MLSYDDDAERLKVYVSPSKRPFVELLKCCSTLCFSWTLLQYIFLYRNCTALLYLNSGRGFNDFSLSVLVLVTAVKNFYESALWMFFGRTQTFKIYVRLIVYIILQSMSKYLAGRAKKLWQIYVVLCSLKPGSKDTVDNRWRVIHHEITLLW